MSLPRKQNHPVRGGFESVGLEPAARVKIFPLRLVFPTVNRTSRRTIRVNLGRERQLGNRLAARRAGQIHGRHVNHLTGRPCIVGHLERS